jgi:CO/xanthine dehydrogenase FAD-binding subunit
MHSHASTSKYQRPSSLTVALGLLRQGFLPIAGGTDYYPSKVGLPLTDQLLDLSGISDFSSISSAPTNSIVLSALTTWRQCQVDFAQHKLPIWCAALAQSAKDVGGWQIQNRGTLGGNLCNASPAADGVVALLALGAQVVLASCAGPASNAPLTTRNLPLGQFVVGNRKTAKTDGELLIQIQLVPHSPRARSVFLKLGHRKYLVISIVMVGVLIDFDETDTVTTCRIAIGSCAKAALRVLDLEPLVVGQPRSAVMPVIQDNLFRLVAAISPIDDIRGTAAYRQLASQELVIRAFTEVLR